MKRTKLFLLFLLALLPFGQSRAYDFCVDGVYYNIASSLGVHVTYGEYSNNTYSGDLVIPSQVKYDGMLYTVTGITSLACYNCYNLNSISIPKTVSLICEKAFYSCSNLKKIYIEDVAAWCNMTRSGSYSNPFTTGYSSKELYLNGELVTKLVIPSHVTSTLDGTFAYCSSITEVVIENYGAQILNETFTSCGNLQKVTISPYVTSIDGRCFRNCSKLKDVIIEDRSYYALTLGDTDGYYGRYDDEYWHRGAFADCPIEYMYIGRNLSYTYNPFRHYDDGDNYYEAEATLRHLEFGTPASTIPAFLLSCAQLEDITLHATTPPSSSSFSTAVYDNSKLIVPWESDKEYRAATPWQNFSQIRYLKTDNQLSMDNATVFAGQTVNIPVMLDNTVTINSLGGIINLPQGMTVARNAKGKFSISLNEDRASQDDAFSVSCNQLADGSIKFLVVSTDGTNISGNDGGIINVPVVIGQELEGKYELHLSAVQMSDADGNLIDCPDAYNTVTVEQYILGDVNRDWQIAPNDITLTIKAYLGDTPDNFCFLAADLNNNGELDPSDITGIIKMYLSQGATRATAAQATTRATFEAEDEVLLSEGNVKPGEECTIDFAMNLKRSDYTSLGGIITLPEGFTFALNAKGKPIVTKNAEVLEYHTVSTNLLADNQLKFYIGSNDLDLIDARLSTLLTIKVVASQDVKDGDYSYTITNLQLSDYDANLYNATDAAAMLHVSATDGIAQAASSTTGTYYTITGIRLPAQPLRKGLYIRNGRKIVVK